MRRFWRGLLAAHLILLMGCSSGVATPATGAADCILAAEEMHRLAVIRTNSRAEQRSMFLSLKQILPDKVHNESLVELRSLHRRSRLGKVSRASEPGLPLVLAVCVAAS